MVSGWSPGIITSYMVIIMYRYKAFYEVPNFRRDTPLTKEAEDFAHEIEMSVMYMNTSFTRYAVVICS